MSSECFKRSIRTYSSKDWKVNRKITRRRRVDNPWRLLLGKASNDTSLDGATRRRDFNWNRTLIRTRSHCTVIVLLPRDYSHIVSPTMRNDSWMLVHIRQYSPLVDARGAIGAVLCNIAAPAFNVATIFSANGNTRDSTNVGQLCVFVVTIFTNVTRHVEKTDEKEWFFRNCAALRFGKRKHRITKCVDRFHHRHSRDCFVVSSIYLV